MIGSLDNISFRRFSVRNRVTSDVSRRVPPSATGDSDKPTVEPVALKPSVDEIYDNKKRQVNSFGQTSGYTRDYEQLVPKPVAATTTEWHEGSATRVAKTKNQAPQQQMAVVAAHARPHAGRGRGAGQRPPATAFIVAVVAFP